MAAKDYIWDSQAATRLEEMELDEHYNKHKAHYNGLARDLWASLNRVSDVPAYLKHGDLWDALLPILTRDSVTMTGFAIRQLPVPPARGGAQWLAWFTHFVTETFLDQEEATT